MKNATLDYTVLNRITERAFYQALRMIDIANHNREVKEKGEPKVGGHATASASSLHILSAIHLALRKPEDYFANKPHVSPVDHALNFLLQNFRDAEGNPLSEELSVQAMHHLRHYSPEGLPVFQSYHAEADPDSYRYFPSGSVGIPPVNALYLSLAYEYAKYHGWEIDESPTFWCLMGDSEFREGSLMEAMPDAGERELKNLIWIVDYNRQNLDGTRIANEKALGGSDADRMLGVARANGWDAVRLKHGTLREKLFASEGGDEFQRVLDAEFSDFEFQALLGANQPNLTASVLAKKSAKLKKWISGHGEEVVHQAFRNLAGHDLQCLVENLGRIQREATKPTLVVAYTIKGWSLRCQALSGNHSTLPEADELDAMANVLGIPLQHPFERFPSSSPEGKFLEKRGKELTQGIGKILQEKEKRRKEWFSFAQGLDWPKDFDITSLKLNPIAHTQWMWGQIAAKLDRLAHDPGTDLKGNDAAWSKVAKYFLTMAPDVGTSTNTSPNMNGKLFGTAEQEDFETLFGSKDRKAPDVVPKLSEGANHLRFEIAEGNCMSAVGSFGKFFHFVGIPFFPSMTIYDFFIKRAHDQYYYNLYWHSHNLVLGTPSGVTLAPEGAQHSWKSDFQIPNSVTWEPCFAKELEWILADSLRRHFTGEDTNREAVLIRGATKGIVQKDLLERLRRQKRYADLSELEIYDAVREHALAGAYALIDYREEAGYVPGDNAVHLFAMGALVPEAIRASDALEQKGIFANVFVVTSPELLLGNLAEKDNYQHLRETLGVSGHLYLNASRKIESRAEWLAVQGNRVPIVSVHDGEAGLLDNIGSIVGVRQKALAVRKTSKSGTTWDIFHYHGLDAGGIAAAAEGVLADTAEEQILIHPSALA